MYSPKQTLITTFISYLQTTYHSIFGTSDARFHELLTAVARTALETIADSDALYHDLEHTLLVTAVGQEILQARRVCQGPTSVTPIDWLHLITALLCHDIGYCKGICHHDDLDLGRHTTGLGNDEYVFLPFGATDAALSPYHVDRGKQFVYEQFGTASLINITVVQQIIDRTRFPGTDSPMAVDVKILANLGRAADLIGQFSDRNYLQKLPALFYEFEQNGTNHQLGYRDLTDIKLGISEFYWNRIHTHVQEALGYLSHTPTGQQIVAELQTNISMDKISLCA